MRFSVVLRAKSVLCASILTCFAAAAQAQTGGESRDGLPDSYQGPASAVAAIVDDKVITTFDVEQRVRLMLLSSGGTVSAQMLPQFQVRAVRDLVEEQLKLKEMAKFEVEVETKAVDDELQGVASQNNMTLAEFEQLLARDGISLETLRRQYLTNIGWMRLVQGRFGNRVRVNPEEIEETLERMRSDATKEQYLVSEICIAVPDPRQAQAYYQGSLQLIEQMREGVPFSVVAQQFSACPSAAAGGDLGWVRAGELPPDLDAALQALPPGSVTNPLPSDGAFFILAVRDKRAAAVPGEPSWRLAYASAPLSMGRTQAITALQRLEQADACGGPRLRIDLGPDVGVVAMQENMTLDDIDERFHTAIEDLKRGDLSPPVEADGALHMVYVCDRDDGLGLPSRSAIEDRIYSRQVTQLAQQYLRDIERRTMVDIRMRPGRAGNG